jgi:hypothetical protein
VYALPKAPGLGGTPPGVTFYDELRRFFNLIDMGIDRMAIGYRSTPVVLAGAKF